MPIYEYRCPDCHQVFEEWCKQVEDSTVTHACPVCSAQAKRLISSTSFSLKGEGWYVTEYGSHKGKSEVAPDAAAPATPAGTSSDASQTGAAASPPPPPAAPAAAEPTSPKPAAGSHEHC